MPKTHTFGAAPEPDTVLMLEQTYHLRRVTRSVQQALGKMDEKMEAARKDDADADRFMTIMIESIDALLEPQGESKPAKTVLLKAWKEDALSVDQVEHILTELSGSGAGPTSATA